MIASAVVVQFFHTCLVNEVDPEVGLAAVRVLQHLGCRVEVPRTQTCCGQPAYNGGFHGEASAAARHTVQLLDQTTGPIVVPSGSCADMLVHQYPLLLDGDRLADSAHRVATRVREFSQFVAAHWPTGKSFGRVAATVAYHPSCHLLRGLSVRSEPLTLLAQVDGVTVTTLRDQEECCGFGGLFSLKHPEISGSMLERKLSHVMSSDADRLVSCDLGCLMHLHGGLHRRGSQLTVQHLSQLLDEALSS